MTVAARGHRPSLVTVDQFAAFLETRPDEERWELVEGVAYQRPPPTLAHQRIASNLARLLQPRADGPLTAQHASRT